MNSSVKPARYSKPNPPNRCSNLLAIQLDSVCVRSPPSLFYSKLLREILFCFQILRAKCAKFPLSLGRSRRSSPVHLRDGAPGAPQQIKAALRQAHHQTSGIHRLARARMEGRRGNAVRHSALSVYSPALATRGHGTAQRSSSILCCVSCLHCVSDLGSPL